MTRVLKYVYLPPLLRPLPQWCLQSVNGSPLASGGPAVCFRNPENGETGRVGETETDKAAAPQDRVEWVKTQEGTGIRGSLAQNII